MRTPKHIRHILVIALAGALLLALGSCGQQVVEGVPTEVQVNGYFVQRDTNNNPTGVVEIGISAFDSQGTQVETATIRSVSATVTTTGYTATGGVCGNITAATGPLAAVLMLDESTSMFSFDPNRDRALAAERFVNDMRSNDVASIAYFPARAGNITAGLKNSEQVAPFSSNKADLIAGINTVTSPYGGFTPLWDAAHDAVTLLRQRSESNRVGIVLTDGQNNAGSETAASANQYARNEGVTMYAVGFGTAAAAELDALVAGTGGYRELIDSSDPDASIANLLANIFAATQAQGCVDLTFAPVPAQNVRIQGTLTVDFTNSSASTPFDIGF